MVILERRSNWDRPVVRSTAFDCLQNALKTKQPGELKGSFEAANEILLFQEVNVKLLRNFKKNKSKN